MGVGDLQALVVQPPPRQVGVAVAWAPRAPVFGGAGRPAHGVAGAGGAPRGARARGGVSLHDPVCYRPLAGPASSLPASQIPPLPRAPHASG